LVGLIGVVVYRIATRSQRRAKAIERSMDWESLDADVRDGLVCSVADLPAPELLEEVRQAYAEGLVDDTVADLEGVERDMVAPKPWRRDRQHLITDAIAEMEWWASFHPEDSASKKRPKLETPLLPPEPPAPSPSSSQRRHSDPEGNQSSFPNRHNHVLERHSRWDNAQNRIRATRRSSEA
jgi:hypothetical protein